MSASKLPLDYLRKARQSVLQLVIVGKDPFPNDPDESHIPFCKKNWEQQMAFNCSGRYVLRSIGIDLEKAKANYASPKLLFEALRSDGLVFLNASYEMLLGKPLRKNEHKKYWSAAHEINKNFIEKSSAAIFCGEAKKVRRWTNSAVNGEDVVHPDIRNKNNKKIEKEWHKWWGESALKNKLKLNLKIAAPSTQDL